jgi:hypothetical protein
VVSTAPILALDAVGPSTPTLLMKFRRRLLLVSHKESTPWDRPYDLPHSFRAAS